MNYLNGGYAMIKHNATQKDLANAYKTNRPVLVYDENQKAHWCQINEKVIETTDEETQETITTYEYSYQLLNDIASLVDSAGNLRFIEGEGEPLEQTGVDITYCRWSLSGTHLMLVVAGTIANSTTLANNVNLAEFSVPNYIFNKVYPVWLTNIEARSIDMYAQDWTKQSAFIKFSKGTSKLAITLGTALTTTAERSFRIQFDLLIDADYNE